MAPVFRRKVDDDEAFERLYERHVRDVYRYAAAMLGEAADAEDVTQTTFLNAYRAFQKGTRPEKPQSWLIAIAHNVCRQRFRQAQRRPHEVAFDEGVGDGNARDEATAPSAEDLRRALSQLSPNQRAAIVMRELEDCSYAEIADVLGITVSALETLLFRARRALREQLDEQLTCKEAAFAIYKQLDGRLSFAERRGLRAHLRACAECDSLAHSQRAQRRALKTLVLVPLPATLSHWFGNQTAAAATGAAGTGGLTAVGAATGGGTAGASSVVLGGIAAKAAVVVAAGALVGGGAYEGVTRVVLPAEHNARRSATPVAVAPTVHRGVDLEAITAPFETPKSTAPQANANANSVRNAHAANPKRHAGNRASVVPPGQVVKTIAAESKALRGSPPGLAVRAARQSKQTSAQAKQSAGQNQRRTRSHSAVPRNAHAKATPASTIPTAAQRGRPPTSEPLPEELTP